MVGFVDDFDGFGVLRIADVFNRDNGGVQPNAISALRLIEQIETDAAPTDAVH